ncbi:BMP family ABC transporter substrate-binding protein [bacterium]|nr:BMP family ABC transporter substrate-binding protein [bacterium]
MKKLLAFMMIIAIISVGCDKKKEEESGSKKIKVGLVFDAGGKNDGSFNQSAWEGAVKAKNELGIVLKDVEPGAGDSSAVEEAMRVFASEGFDVIFGIGFANATAIEHVATEYPNIKFAIVDSEVKLPNVSSLLFKEHEGSFLVGMVAAMRAREVKGKQIIGFIGGMDIPLIHKFELGYKAGAEKINPGIQVIVNYVGNTPTAWSDPAKAKEIALSQIGKGATVIYAAAGASGNGLFDALMETNGRGPCNPVVANGIRTDKCIYGIGVDSNQNHKVPGQIATSMLKRVDVSVFDTIKKATEGKLTGGVSVYGLNNNGVGYALDENNSNIVTQKMQEAVEKYKQLIINGTITVQSER